MREIRHSDVLQNENDERLKSHAKASVQQNLEGRYLALAHATGH